MDTSSSVRRAGMGTGAGVEQPERVIRRVLVGVLAVIAAVFAAVATSSGADVGDRDIALLKCLDYVREQLVLSPSTAEFASVADARVQPTADDRWFVRSNVDAPDSSGAMIRSEWSCDAHYVGEGEWRLRAEILD